MDAISLLSENSVLVVIFRCCFEVGWWLTRDAGTGAAVLETLEDTPEVLSVVSAESWSLLTLFAFLNPSLTEVYPDWLAEALLYKLCLVSYSIKLLVMADF